MIQITLMNILNLLKTEQYQIKKLTKGSTLFHEGDTCRVIGIIIKGKIKISSFLIDGTEIIYNQLSNNDIFGNSLIFSSTPIYKGDIIALTDCEIAIIDKKQLLKLLSTNQDFLINYLQIQSNFSKSLNDKIKLLSIASAQERLYYYLYINKNVITFDSVQELAKQLSLSREATSRLLSKLIKEEKIIRTNNTIKLL